MTIPAKFMAATENGTIFCGNRKMSPNQIEKSFKAHYGTIVALRRNPLIPKKFLSVGDWSAKVSINTISYNIDNDNMWLWSNP